MNDINRDLPEVTLGWVTLGQQLAGYIATMSGDEDHLIIETPAIPGEVTPYVQFCCIGDDGWRVEVSGNRVLAEQFQLSAAELEALMLLGWNLPEDDDKCPNLWVHGDDPATLARMACAALSGQFQVPFPEFLTVNGWGPAAQDIAAIGLIASREVPTDVVDLDDGPPIGPPTEWAQRSESREELIELVRESLGHLFEEVPPQDDDEDFVITHDGTPIYVRVSPGMPMVEILTRLAHDVRSRRQAALEVSVLNRTHPMVKFLLHDRSVLLVLSIPAMPFAHHHLAALLPDFISTRDEVIDDLVLRTQGRKA
ncbi:MAG TPA: hypothetical protein VIR30_21500 [Nocardioides sp.]